MIATTMYDAFHAAETIMGDASSADKQEELPPLPRLQDAGFGNKRIISWSDWKSIDAEERRRGALLGKEREKFVRIEEMLRVAQ